MADMGLRMVSDEEAWGECMRAIVACGWAAAFVSMPETWPIFLEWMRANAPRAGYQLALKETPESFREHVLVSAQVGMALRRVDGDA